MNNVNWKTFKQCYEEYLKEMDIFKKNIKIINKHNDYFAKKFNFDRFKQNIRHRKFNCIAGMTFDSKTNLYCDFNEWEFYYKAKNSSNH